MASGLQDAQAVDSKKSFLKLYIYIYVMINPDLIVQTLAPQSIDTDVNYTITKSMYYIQYKERRPV